MLYSDNAYLKFERVKLACDFPKVNPFTRFVRSKLCIEKGEVAARPVGMDKSNVVLSLAKTDSLIVLPGSTRSFQKGDWVTALLLEDDKGSQTLRQDTIRN